MDQPYSRIADTLLDYQYWAPDDPQRNPYDDTGWTFGELFNVQGRARHRRQGARRGDGAGQGRADRRRAASAARERVFAINHNADPSLATLRYRFKDAQFDVAEEPFEAAGQKFNRGSFIIRGRRAPTISARRPPSSA